MNMRSGNVDCVCTAGTTSVAFTQAHVHGSYSPHSLHPSYKPVYTALSFYGFHILWLSYKPTSTRLMTANCHGPDS